MPSNSDSPGVSDSNEDWDDGHNTQVAGESASEYMADDEAESVTFRVTLDEESLEKLKKVFPTAQNRTEAIRKAVDLSIWERREWLNDNVPEDKSK